MMAELITRDQIIEVDYKSRKESARMEISYNTPSAGYRALPLQTIGNESFIGFTHEENRE